MHSVKLTAEPGPVPRRRLLAAGLVAVGVVAAAGCDLDVATPGQGEEHEIDRLEAVEAFLRGVNGRYAFAAAGPAGLGGVYLAAALLSDELVHAGHRHGHRALSDGIVSDHMVEVDELWAAASEARVVAENLPPRIRRLMETPAADLLETRDNVETQLTESLLWAGFANRMMGDNFCVAVIDAGPLQDRTEFYRRAEAYFTEAIASASDFSRDTLRQIGHAGRAQVRLHLDDWSGAVADAAEVADFVGFSHHHGWHVWSDTDWNHLATQSWEQGRFTVWGTPFADWLRRDGTITGDPRVRYQASAAMPVGEDRRRPLLRQVKLTNRNHAIPLVKGPEMRLIEAEAALRQGNWQVAVERINHVRAFRRSALGGLPVAERTPQRMPDVSASNAEEAWELLMRERGIELYLEGRRLADLRRWARSPGWVSTTVIREVGPGAPDTDARRPVLDTSSEMCIPIGDRERRTNPNLQG